MKEFINTRATLVKVGELTTYYGWVDPGAEGVLVIDSENAPPGKFGDEFNVQLCTSLIGTQFVSSYMGSEGHIHLFSVPAAVNIERRRHDDVRRRNLVKHALYKSPDGPVVLDVLDVSKNGIGFATQIAFPVGVSLNLYVTNPQCLDRVIEMKVEIIYSKKREGSNAGFRCGCSIIEMIRPDRVKWDLLIESPNEG